MPSTTPPLPRPVRVLFDINAWLALIAAADFGAGHADLPETAIAWKAQNATRTVLWTPANEVVVVGWWGKALSALVLSRAALDSNQLIALGDGYQIDGCFYWWNEGSTVIQPFVVGQSIRAGPNNPINISYATATSGMVTLFYKPLG